MLVAIELFHCLLLVVLIVAWHRRFKEQEEYVDDIRDRVHTLELDQYKVGSNNGSDQITSVRESLRENCRLCHSLTKNAPKTSG